MTIEGVSISSSSVWVETLKRIRLIQRPNVVEQLHAPECVLARLLLQMRRGDVALGDFLGEASMFFIGFRVDREKAHIVRLHVVLPDEAMPEGGRRRAESPFSADLNRHDHE